MWNIVKLGYSFSPGLLTVMFGAAGTRVSISRIAQNLGKLRHIKSFWETHTVSYCTSIQLDTQ